MLLLTEGVKQMIGSITQSSPLLIYMVHERGDGHVSKTSLGKGWKKKKKFKPEPSLKWTEDCLNVLQKIRTVNWILLLRPNLWFPD